MVEDMVKLFGNLLSPENAQSQVFSEGFHQIHFKDGRWFYF